MRDVIATELNVKTVELGGDAAMRRSLKPNFRTLGPDFGNNTKAVAAAIRRAEPGNAIARLRAEGRFTVEVDGGTISVDDTHVQILEEPSSGWQISTDGPYSVAMDLKIDRDLRIEGLARELVRFINNLRKRHELELDERIVLNISTTEDTTGEFVTMIESHSEAIARDVLADTITSDSTGPATGDRFTTRTASALITLRRAAN